MSEDRYDDAPDVLIVDDDEGLRGALRLALEGRGYRCGEAEDGPRAVDLARRRPPRCLFLDLGMPGMDGFAVARRLREDPTTRDIPIHCLTGRTDEEIRSRVAGAGFEELLIKPVDPSRLLEIVGRHVRWSPRVEGLTKSEAEGLMDWLEARGCVRLETRLSADGRFSVRCVCPPGSRLMIDPGGAVRLVPD